MEIGPVKNGNPYSPPITNNTRGWQHRPWMWANVFLANGVAVLLCFLIAAQPFPIGVWQILAGLWILYQVKLTSTALAKSQLGLAVTLYAAAAFGLVLLTVQRGAASPELSDMILLFAIAGALLLVIPTASFVFDIKKTQQVSLVQLAWRSVAEVFLLCPLWISLVGPHLES